MSAGATSSPPPEERFVIVALADGAVLLDLVTGVAFALNTSAAFVWRLRLEGHAVSAIEAALADRFGLAPAQAAGDVAAAVALPAAPAFPLPSGDFSYELHGDRYHYSFRGKQILEIAADGTTLRSVSAVTRAEAAFHLLALSPKLLALGGAAVLHAGAVAQHHEASGEEGKPGAPSVAPSGPLRAFTGPSGAGKTTAARAFAAAGLRLVAQDKLIVRLEQGRPLAVLDGEERIGAWVSRLAPIVSAAEVGHWCPIGDLAHAAAGDGGPIAEILLIDRSRRAGSVIAREPLGPTRAAAELFLQLFYGSGSRAAWELQLGTAAALASEVNVFSATMPAGVEHLESAARAEIKRLPQVEVTRSNRASSSG